MAPIFPSVIAEPLSLIKTDNHPQVIIFQYDKFSRLSSQILPHDLTTVYHYDSYNGLASIDRPMVHFAYTYNQDGSIRERVRSNHLGQQAIEHYQYDANHNLKDYACSGMLCPHDAQGQALAYQHYTFDAFNNIKTVSSNQTTTTYDYDHTYPTRLLRYHNSNPDYPGSGTLVYDHNGNITKDDQGNLITYDALDETQSVTTKKGTSTYIYNGMGTQVGERLSGKAMTYFIYGQAGLLNTQENTDLVSFLYGINRLGQQDQHGMQYDLTDQGQSVVVTVRPNAKHPMIKRYAYSPYGIESELNYEGGTNQPTQHFGFDGQLTDSYTHWQFLGHGYRAYNPMLHRFMHQDSLSPFDKGGLNGYVFGNNNPIMMIDPSGHASFWANMAFGFAAGAVGGLLTFGMGGVGSIVVNAIFGAIGSNLDTIVAAAHGKAINVKSTVVNTALGAALGALGGESSEAALEAEEVGAASKPQAGCFTGDTLVAVAGNKKIPIKDIKLGTWVVSPVLPKHIAKHAKQPKYDKHPITPQTWKEVDLQYVSVVNHKTRVNHIVLLRPMTWLHQHHITQVGQHTTLLIPGFGIKHVYVVVMAIKPVDINTRGINWLTQNSAPVIGKFERYVTNVHTYTFQDQAGRVSQLKATPQHPFYVENKHDFFPIQAVSHQDQLMGADHDMVRLVRAEAGKSMPEVVDNLEVYKRHSYRVGPDEILVHNMCEKERAALVLQGHWRAYLERKGYYHYFDPIVKLPIPDNYAYVLLNESKNQLGSKTEAYTIESIKNWFGQGHTISPYSGVSVSFIGSVKSGNTVRLSDWAAHHFSVPYLEGLGNASSTYPIWGFFNIPMEAIFGGNPSHAGTAVMYDYEGLD